MERIKSDEEVDIRQGVYSLYVLIFIAQRIRTAWGLILLTNFHPAEGPIGYPLVPFLGYSSYRE